MGWQDLTIDTGQLRHRVELQEPVMGRDGYGQDGADGWTTRATQWAKITPLSGREYAVAMQVSAVVTHAVEMRFNPEITIGTTWRAVYGSRVLNILAVLDIQERHVKTVLLCKETPPA